MTTTHPKLTPEVRQVLQDLLTDKSFRTAAEEMYHIEINNKPPQWERDQWFTDFERQHNAIISVEEQLFSLMIKPVKTFAEEESIKELSHIYASFCIDTVIEKPLKKQK